MIVPTRMLGCYLETETRVSIYTISPVYTNNMYDIYTYIQVERYFI